MNDDKKESIGAMTEYYQGQQDNNTAPVSEEPRGRVIMSSELITGGAGSAELRAAQAALLASTPVDVPVNVAETLPNTAKPTKKVAAQAMLTPYGVTDHQIFEYDVDSPFGTYADGTPEDGQYLFNTGAGAGNAGGIIGADLKPRALDSSEGSPYFFDGAVPASYNPVLPFTVDVPEYGLQAEVETTDPQKIAYLLATGVGGLPEEQFLGYSNISLQPGEGWPSVIGKTFRMYTPAYTDFISNAKIRATTAFDVAQQRRRVLNDLYDNDEYKQLQAAVLGGDKDAIDKIRKLEQDTLNNDETINALLGIKDEKLAYLEKEFANKMRLNNAALNIGATPNQSMFYGIASNFAAQLGLMGMVGAISSPQVATLASSGIFYFANQDELERNLKENMPGLTPFERHTKSMRDAVPVSALEAIGNYALFGSRINAVRRHVKSNFARYANAAGERIAASQVDAVSEVAQNRMIDYLSNNMRDDNYNERLRADFMTYLLVSATGLASVPGALVAEKVQKARDMVEKGQLTDDTDPLATQMAYTARLGAQIGALTPDQTFAEIIDLASPEGQAYLDRSDKITFDGALDKFTPEALKQATDLMSGLKEENFNDFFKRFRADVSAAIPEEITGNTRTVLARTFDALQAVALVKGGGELALPKMEVVDKVPDGGYGQYNRATDTMQIARYPNDSALRDATFVSGTDLAPISVADAAWLHEIAHYYDRQLRRKDGLFEKFLPTYFGMLAKTYGDVQAGVLKQVMTEQNKGETWVPSDTKGALKAQDTTEWFASSWMRMGRELLKNLGFEGNVAEVLDVATILATRMQLPSYQAALGELNRSMRTLIQNNDAFLTELARAHEEEGLAKAIQDYMAGDTKALGKDEIAKLLDVLKTSAGVDGEKILAEAFESVNPPKDGESFSEQILREFEEAIDRNAQIEGSDNINAAKRINRDAAILEKAEGKSDKTLPAADFGRNPVARQRFEEDLKTLNLFGLDEQITQDDNDVKKMAGYNPVAEAQEEARALEQEREKTGFPARAAEKVNGRTYEEDVAAFKDAVNKIKKTPKIMNWVLANQGTGSVANILWLIGGDEAVNKLYPIEAQYNIQESDSIQQMEKFESRVVGKGKLFKNRLEHNTFLNKARMRSIEAKGVYDAALQQFVDKVISPAHAMSVYAWSKDPVEKARTLKAFNGNAANMQAVIDQLTPEQKSYVDEMQGDRMDHWDEYRQGYNDEGKIVGKRKGSYWPSMSAHRVAMGDVRPNFEAARNQDLDYPMAVGTGPDAIELFGQQIRRSAGGKSGFYRTIQRLKDIVDYKSDNTTADFNPENQALEAQAARSSADMRALLAHKLGDPQMVQNFAEALDDYVAKSDSQIVSNSYVSIFGRNVVTSFFIARPMQFIKQLTDTISGYGAAENQAAYWANTAKAVGNLPAAIKEMLQRSAWVRNRIKGLNYDEQLTASAAHGGDSALMRWAASKSNLKPGLQSFLATYQSWNRAALELGLSPMQAGDVGSIIVGGYGLLKEFDAKYPGDPERAVREWEVAMQRRRSNTNQAMRSLTQRRWNRDWRGQALALMNDQMMKGASIFRAFMGAYRGERSAKSAAMEISSITLSILAFMLITAGIWDLWDDNEENDEAVYNTLKSEAISNVLGINPVANAMLSPIIQSMLSDYEYRFGMPITNMISRMTKEDNATRIGDALTGLGILAPAARLLEIGEGVSMATSAEPEKAEAGRRVLVGASVSSAKRRAGVKKDVDKNDEDE